MNVDPHNCISEQSSLVTSSEAEDGSELDAYISGGANLFGLLSATVTGSLKLLDKDKGIMNIFLQLLEKTISCYVDPNICRRRKTRPSLF